MRNQHVHVGVSFLSPVFAVKIRSASVVHACL